VPVRRIDVSRAALLAFLALFAALFCSPSVASKSVLAPFERSEWPAFLERLKLPEHKAYAVLIHLPSAYPILLADANATRDSLVRNVLRPRSHAIAKAMIGHAMVGWQCSTGKGLISKTGQKNGQAMKMVLAGWGITPLLSIFNDGRLVALDQNPDGYKAQIYQGRASILAVEISEHSCQAMRQRLVNYISHPGKPARRYGLLLDSDGFEGDGCMSFALHVLAKAGLFSGIGGAFDRTIRIYDGMLGRRTRAPEDVEPYVRAASEQDERRVAWLRLRFGSWKAGRLREEIKVKDPELVYAAIASLRRLAGERAGRHQRRALSSDDPSVRRAVASTRAWAKRRFRVMRFIDPDESFALVLER
jgi:hypothetical protein